MSGKYDIKDLFSIYKSGRLFEESAYGEAYKFWVESYVEINKPDFIALFDMENLKAPFVYSKNYGLKFSPNRPQSVQEIIDSVSKDQIDRIYEADRLCIEFLQGNSFLANAPLFQLRFTVNLIKGSPVTLLRQIVFIPGNGKRMFLKVFLLSFTDITALDGIHDHPKIDIKHYSKEAREIKLINNLKYRLTNILLGRKKLTPREEQVLRLIAEGDTSQQIAEKLQISVNTVNTHRQNLMRKFGVKNTIALVNKI